MDPLTQNWVRKADTLRSPEIADLVARHRSESATVYPDESNHGLDITGLERAGVTLFVGGRGSQTLGMAGLASIGPGWGEVKSVYVRPEARGLGLARALMDHVLALAENRGFSRVSLETGTDSISAAARNLYATLGFTACGPFGSYKADPNSCYYVMDLPRDPR